MFRSTTLRLTGWYMLILMSLSIIFSVVIYRVTSGEIQARLESVQTTLRESHESSFTPYVMSEALQDSESHEATTNLTSELLFINLITLIVGGLGSYVLARRSLMPLEKAHKAQSRFTSDASHELRTPLAIMKTEIEVALRDSNATTKSLKEVLSSSLEEVDKLSKLSEMLLNLSRLEHAKLKMSKIDLNKITRGIIKNFNQPNSRITINTVKQLIAYGNETAIAELIKILIDNSLLYSPSDSTVTVILSKQDQFAKFEIINVGPGIQPELLPHIFERFYRADLSRTKGDKKGYGLGLSLAKNIIELHGSSITATSEPGKETRFSFTLPTKPGETVKNTV